MKRGSDQTLSIPSPLNTMNTCFVELIAKRTVEPFQPLGGKQEDLMFANQSVNPYPAWPLHQPSVGVPWYSTRILYSSPSLMHTRTEFHLHWFGALPWPLLLLSTQTLWFQGEDITLPFSAGTRPQNPSLSVIYILTLSTIIISSATCVNTNATICIHSLSYISATVSFWVIKTYRYL